MKRMTSVLALSLTVLGSEGKTQTDVHSTKAMLDYCEIDSPTFEYGICAGRLQGMGVMMGVLCAGVQSGAMPETARGAAMEGMASPEMLIQAFKNFARANPRTWPEYWVATAIDALRTEFPCQ